MDRAQALVKDASFVKTKALPAEAAAVYSDGLDLGALSSRGVRLVDCELLIQAPALAVADLADAATMTYAVQMDNDSAFGSPTTILPSVIVQTGAGGAGAAAASIRLRLPSNCERYVRVSATNSAAGEARDKSMTVSLLF